MIGGGVFGGTGSVLRSVICLVAAQAARCGPSVQAR